MAYTTIDDPSAHFQVTLYTGNSGDNAITNDGNSDLQPDWIWVKNRGATQDHVVFDSSRGFNGDNDSLYIETNNTDAESHNDNDHLKSFNSDGFTMQGGSGRSNNNTVNFVAWQWKANGGTVANDTNGDITTSVQANQTAGFSIATYTGNGGSGQTLGHGLGAEAEFVWFKNRGSTGHHRIYVKLLGASKYLNLNTTDAASASTNIFPSASSTTIGVEQNDVMNESSGTHVMYSFRSIQGYSKIGSYTGNGNDNGPFVYTGFKPAWLMLKRTDNARPWFMFDNKRNPSNVMKIRLKADSNAADDTSNDNRVDLLSNGFKIRDDALEMAASGGTYIYMAFAEHPFVSSKGVPVTAR